jgi:hypothetical protein
MQGVLSKMQFGKKLINVKSLHFMKHRNILCVLLMQMIFLTSFSQEIKYRCYLKSQCNADIKELKIYQLNKGSFNYFSENRGSIAILSDTGMYVLKSSELAIEGDSMLVHIGYGINIDTVKQRDIIDVVFIDSKPLKGMSQGGGWLCCGKPCNGYKADYYNNGQKLIEGKFKNGKPVGELKFYNQRGQLKYIEYYNKRGRKRSIR